MLTELDPVRLEDFQARILAHPRARIDGRSLWACFAAAFPGRPQGSDERRWFLSALEQLAAAGAIRLPSKRGKLWEHALGVSTPLAVELVRGPVRSRSQAWRAFPWHPKLAWIAELVCVTPEQERFLLDIHKGLVNGSFARRAPLKYRSLQLTGDEKRLSRLLHTPLFSSNRLDLDLLGCVDEPLPMAWHAISSQATMVIMENAGAFSVARRLLEALADPPYGMIGFGGGAALEDAIRYLPTLDRPISEIHYVGDLDRAGLRIVMAARKVALREGLPDILPARGLHATMLAACDRFAQPLGWPHDGAAAGPLPQDGELLEWLPADTRMRVREIIQAGRRVPEEILGTDELTSVWAA